VNTYRLLEKESGQTIRLTVLTPESERGPSRLVVFSHGNGGAGALYRRLAEHLVRAGFVVALPDHPGNTRTDNRLAGTAANLEARPKHVKTVIDWAFDASPFAGTLKRDTAAILGHSLGGYTALAAAGDARVKALVLLAPATLWFQAPGSLDHVDVPILMFTAGQDEHTPAPHAEVVARGLPDPTLLEHHVIRNAGHFSFLDPFPPEKTSPAFAPSQDPPGFDRSRFLDDLGPLVAAFLERVL